MKCLCPNVEAQSYLGRRAIDNTQLTSVPFDEARVKASPTSWIIGFVKFQKRGSIKR